MIKDDLNYFFLLGFQKSGTSTIHNWLNQIDAISLPDIKECLYSLWFEFELPNPTP